MIKLLRNLTGRFDVLAFGSIESNSVYLHLNDLL
jgi:hypothetical protein